MNEVAEKLLQLITASAKRRDVMILLLDGVKELNIINHELGTSSAAVLPQIRKLEAEKLVEQSEVGYGLTVLGREVAMHLKSCVDFLNTIGREKSFWDSHDIEGIPERFRYRVRELGEYEIVSGSKTDMYRPLTKFLDPLKGSEWVRGVSPIFHPDYPTLFSELAQDGVELSLVLTQDVVEAVVERYSDELESLVDLENAEILVSKDDIGVAFTVSDCVLSLGLFDKEGHYDVYSDLVSQDEGAVAWGSELFEYFREGAMPVERYIELSR